MPKWLCNRSLFIAVIEPLLFVNWMGRWVYGMTRMRMSVLCGNSLGLSIQVDMRVRNANAFGMLIISYEGCVLCTLHAVNSAHTKQIRLISVTINNNRHEKSNRFWCVSHHSHFFSYFLTTELLSFELKNTVATQRIIFFKQPLRIKINKCAMQCNYADIW